MAVHHRAHLGPAGAHPVPAVGGEVAHPLPALVPERAQGLGRPGGPLLHRLLPGGGPGLVQHGLSLLLPGGGAVLLLFRLGGPSLCRLPLRPLFGGFGLLYIFSPGAGLLGGPAPLDFALDVVLNVSGLLDGLFLHMLTSLPSLLHEMSLLLSAAFASKPDCYKKSEKSYKMVTAIWYTILSLPSSPEFPAPGQSQVLGGHILLLFPAIPGTPAHFIGLPAKPPKFTPLFRPFVHPP